MNTLTMTENAAKRISELISSEKNNISMLRVLVSSGGCSGFSYSFELESKINEDDRVFEQHGIKTVIDDVSLDILGNSEIDFVEDLAGSAFKLNIPNATSSCGCGVSFAV
ncbi:MAG: iron-sulfur cluster insertion protein ErpA [Rhodospirillales bacterium]|tara:strand:- start:1523 stop:1852 length:330 start_codon:yes stop_codon:yes gene_type:complete